MGKEVSAEAVRSEVGKFADRVSADNVKETIRNESNFKLLFKNVDRLSRYCNDICLVFAMLRDFTTGRYTKCPWRTIALLVGTLGYVISPFDLVPDFIPVAGWSDDGLALALVLALVRMDLDAYKAWKATQPADEMK